MKKFIFYLIFVLSFVEAAGTFAIQKPIFAPEGEYNFISQKQEAALNDISGFYYRLSVQYIPPYLIDLETDEYYMLKEQKKSKFSLSRLCKKNIIDFGKNPLSLTFKVDDEDKERTVFLYAPYIAEQKKCVINKNILFLPKRSYRHPLNIEVSLNLIEEPVFTSGWERDSLLLENFSLKNRKSIQKLSFSFDPNEAKTNTLYIPLNFITNEGETINTGFIAVILHPVASKVMEAKFTDYGYPDLSDAQIDKIEPIAHPFNKNRNLKKDIALLSKIAKSQDPNDIEGCSYVMDFINEYALSEYDKNMLFWLIFKNNPDFKESLCYKEHEKYLVYTNSVPQPKDFVIPVLKPSIYAKEVNSSVLLARAEVENVVFEANRSIKEFEQNMTVVDVPSHPLIYNQEDQNQSSGLKIAEETNEHEQNITQDTKREDNTSSLKLTYQEKNKQEQNVSTTNRIVLDSQTPSVQKPAQKEMQTLKKEPFDYKKLPFSGISNEERSRVFKIFSSILRSKNKKHLISRVFPKQDIDFTILSPIPALTMEGIKAGEKYLLDRNSIAQILSPLEKNRLGCWFLLRTMKIKDKKAVSLAEELNQDNYEMAALYQDKNKEVGNNGYLIIYVTYKRYSGKRFVIKSLAFDLPDENFYKTIKDRTSKKSKCYRLIQNFKKDIE